MLETSGRKFLPLGKILAANFNRLAFHLYHIISFLFIFCPGQLSLHQKEMDGPVSALLLTGELEARQSLTYFGFVLVQGLSTTCAQKKLWLLEKLFCFGLKWGETLGSCGL